MEKDYLSDASINSAKSMVRAHYENCKFLNISVQNQDLSAYTFTDCIFINCDLSNCKIQDTGFQDVHFDHCKMIGLPFTYSKSLGFCIHCIACLLNDSSFYQFELHQSTFKKCELKSIDFVEADLKGSQILECDLTDSIFERTHLEKADLRDSYGFRIDPDINYVSGAHFSRYSLAGLLRKYDIKIQNR
jgi:uncharacterized protein YjbI with pentapeptide repeats